jgi:threonine dehydrogenase-like Zn-dependent dehydrogenase
MKGLLYGVRPDQWEPPDSNPLLAGFARAPMKLEELDRPRPDRAGWVTAKTRICGICGSDAKQVFMDFGEGGEDSPLGHLFTFPTVLGHEVVAEIGEPASAAGGEGLEPGRRVVLNPWLSCEPRGMSPRCPSCDAGDYSLCWNFTSGSLAAGIHTGTCKDAPGGFAEYFPAHRSMLIPVPDEVPDELAVFADPFAVSLHSVTRHPPAPGGRALVYGAGALGITATAILRALFPDVEVMVVARFDAQAELARDLGATVVANEPREAVVEEVARWSGSVLQPVNRGLPMAHPGKIDVVYDTIGKPETFEVGVRLLKTRGTLVKSGVHAPGRWEYSPLYFKEITWVGSNAFGIEEVGGVRKHGIAHYLDLVAEGRVDLTGMLTHTFRIDQWREAFSVLADQERSRAIKVAFDFR